jgi:DNA-directed RNA polymerase subunit RPC12/RpoP
MTVTLETAYPCPCGHRIRAIMTATVRVNKRSLRTLGVMLGFIEHHHCPECGAEVPREHVEREPYRLAAKDAERVAEYRKRRFGIDDDGVAVERVAG